MRRRSGDESLDTIENAVRARLPKSLEPQLASLIDVPPQGDEWLHEVKLDGYRLICFIDHGKVRFVTRKGNDWTDKLGSLADAAARLPVTQAILDGELVALDSQGVAAFSDCSAP